jgi:excisionase family DNA binding protein
MATIVDPRAKRQALENGTYDVPDIAALLKCSERHVRRMIDAREIPGLIRVGRLVRFSKRIVDDWLIEKAKCVVQ